MKYSFDKFNKIPDARRRKVGFSNRSRRLSNQIQFRLDDRPDAPAPKRDDGLLHSLAERFDTLIYLTPVPRTCTGSRAGTQKRTPPIS